MNKIHLHEQEILEKFDERFSDGCFGFSIGEEHLQEVRQFISAALNSQIEVIKEMVEKKGDIRIAKADGSAEENFDYGYDVKTKEVLEFLTPHEEEKK